MPITDVKLGRRPADPAQLARMPQLAGHLMAAKRAPRVLDRSHIAFQPEMNGNDDLGDCTAVGIANAIRAAAAMHNYTVPISTEQVIAFYSASAGYDPADPMTDQGAVMADVLQYQAQHGLIHGAQDMWVGDFAVIDHGDLNAVRSVMAHCGAVYLGVDLALADQTDSVWDTRTPGDQRPGSWGGHALLAWSYTGTRDDDHVMLATWGELRPATWRWLRSRMSEAHMVIWRTIGGVVPGLDYDALKNDMAAFIASPIA